MLDFHSHLIPGVDDGAADIAEAREGLSTMKAQGVTTIITTPHVQASLTERKPQLDRYLEAVDRAFEKLQELAEQECPDVKLERGMEVMLDTPYGEFSDPRLRLAGTMFVLVEFPYMSIPPNSTQALRHLRTRGLIPIVAHPERYANISSNPGLIESWGDAGAGIQVNSGSILGRYGATAKRIALLALEQGWAHYLSSDYHSRGRCLISDCRKAFAARGGNRQWEMLTETNPERILLGELPLHVDPLEEPQLSFWQKVFNR